MAAAAVVDGCFGKGSERRGGNWGWDRRILVGGMSCIRPHDAAGEM